MTVGERSSPTRVGPRSAWVAAGVLGVAVVLWGGYSHHWPWTGINGHTATLWDWLHLLLRLLPLLLPSIVMPSVRPLLLARVAFIETEEPEEHGHGDGG